MSTKLASGYVDLTVKYSSAMSKIAQDITGVQGAADKAAQKMSQTLKKAGGDSGKGFASTFSSSVTTGMGSVGIGRWISNIRAEGQKSGNTAGMLIGKSISAGATAALTVGVAGIAGIFGMALKKGFDRYRVLDSVNQRLRAMGKTGDQVKSIMADINAVVDKTPISLADAANESTKFLTGGIKQGQELKSVLTAIADAAGSSGQSFSDVSLIFSQVMNKGKLQAEEMLQLNERNIPIQQWLQKELGVTGGVLAEMSKKGQISFQDLLKAVESNAGGMAKKLGDTIDGALSNMQTSIARVGANFLSAIFGDPMVDDGPNQMVTALNRVTEKFNELNSWVISHSDEIKKFFTDAASVAGGLVEVLAKITGFLLEHPGLIAAVVTAFAAWKTIEGVAAVHTALQSVNTLLGVTLPASAASGATAISAALGPVAAMLAAITGGVFGLEALGRNRLDSRLLDGASPEIADAYRRNNGDLGAVNRDLRQQWFPAPNKSASEQSADLGGLLGAPAPPPAVKQQGPIPNLPSNIFPKSTGTGSGDGGLNDLLIPKRAAGGRAGVDKRGRLFGPGTGTSDSILGIGLDGIPTAWVSTGEGIVNKAAMDRGAGAIVESLNNGTMPLGYVGPERPKKPNDESNQGTHKKSPDGSKEKDTIGGSQFGINPDLGKYGIRGPWGKAGWFLPWWWSHVSGGDRQIKAPLDPERQKRRGLFGIEPGQWGDVPVRGPNYTPRGPVRGGDQPIPGRPWDPKDEWVGLGLPGYSGGGQVGKKNNNDWLRLLDPTKPLGPGKASEKGLQADAVNLNRSISALFPQVNTIGGYRSDALPYHPSGRALDIMIPDWDTPEGKALGDRIVSHLRQNAGAYNLADTIWRDQWADFKGNASTVAGHQNHIHATVKGAGAPEDGQEYFLPPAVQQMLAAAQQQMPLMTPKGGDGAELPTMNRTEGYIPAAAGSSGKAGSSFASGLIDMGAEAINGLIDQAASAASQAASAGLTAGTMGAGAAGGPAAGAAAQMAIGMGTQAAKRGVQWGADMLGIGIDSLAEIVSPFGVPRFFETDPTGFMPNFSITPAATTTVEAAAQAALGNGVDPNSAEHGTGLGAAPGPDMSMQNQWADMSGAQNAQNAMATPFDPTAVAPNDFSTHIDSVVVKDVGELQQQLTDRQQLNMMRYAGRPSAG